MKSIFDGIRLRIPGGDLYYRKQKASKLLACAKKNGDIKLIPFAEYLLDSIDRVYFRGGKCYSECLDLFSKYFEIDNDGMISLGGVFIPKPKVEQLHLFEYEFYDLLMPFLTDDKIDQYAVFFHEGPYEISKKVCVREGDVVVDAGANMGWFSAVASKKVGSKGKVIAFEPSQTILDNYLNRTASYNSNICIAQYGLTDYSGKAEFIKDFDNIGAGYISNGGTNETTESIQVIKLDDYVEKNGLDNISFIKSDIEGAERDMLRGATRILKDMAPRLAICTYHLPDDKEVLEKIILDANPKYKIEHHYLKLYAYCD